MNLNMEAALTSLRTMTQAAIALIPSIGLALFSFVLFWFVSRWAARGVTALVRRTNRPANVGFVLSRLTQWALLALGLFVSLIIVVPSLDAAALFGALGIGGVAIGFAFKDIFQNLMAGLLILITRPFVIGDQIVTGDHEGTIEDIQVRATLMRTYDNRLVVIPNSELYTNRVIVNTARDKRRASVDVGIGYGDDVALAKRAALDALDRLPSIERDPAPSAVVTGLGDFSVNLQVRFWVGPPTRGDVVAAKDEAFIAIKDDLVRAGVDLPFPTYQLLFPSQAERSVGAMETLKEGSSD
ncbi:mechanosensitive ion channel family protein [Ottowia sp. GY511]|nr:mechanosensitive ion channel family protein [Ottowia sp. GY511]TXK23471.1 mechanosensitive ion channel family protein [Ottowia sp. GY511]